MRRLYSQAKTQCGCERILLLHLRFTVDEIKTPKEYKERMKRKRTEDWSGKQLHGHFKRETKDLSGV